ncbi:hypothetical protein GCM10010336_36410 [Streptomyces goshikiensis]|nr:hypothetical protein GCM10010336_36410 [Streptomyces goshikiensis]
MAMAPKTSATIDTRPINARWDRLKRDSQDMVVDLSAVTKARAFSLAHAGTPRRRPQVLSLSGTYRVRSMRIYSARGRTSPDS